MFELERIQKIIRDLEGIRVTKWLSIDEIFYKKGDFKTPQLAEESDSPYLTFDVEGRWGNKEDRYFFKSEFQVEESHADTCLVLKVITGKEKEWDALNPQFLLFVDGEMKQGLDVNHNEILLRKRSVLNEKITFHLHGFAGMQGQPVGLIMSVGILNESLEQLIYDLKVPYDGACLLDPNAPEYVYLVKHLTKAINLIYTFDMEGALFNASVENARNYLKTTIYSHEALKKTLLHEELLPQVSLIGHTHIDVAWLWTLKQTREKVVRSFSTVLDLMTQYPEYQFMASQPVLLSFIEEDYPDLFERIQEQVKNNRFEIEGGMWLEADCNLSSGESLIRHILYGKAYMDEKFNVKSEILWLPDVFGYSAALPQILKQCGIHTFVTTKISWNEFNKMPYDTFMWEGLDKTEILTYFITMMDYKNVEKGSFKTVYEGSVDANHIKGAWARYQQKHLNTDIMVSYGYGDGGGGPTKQMIEQGKRLSHYIPGLPTVKFDQLKSYFKKLHEKGINWPKWTGELYLEYHRGTLTTMALNKWYNRKSEFLYLNLEFLSVLGFHYGLHDYGDIIQKGWKTILLNQFHDIIPGTSIEEVYKESHRQYETILMKGKALKEKLISGISSKQIPSGKDLLLYVVNYSHVTKEQIICFDSAIAYDIEGMDIQRDGEKHYFVDTLPSKGYKTYPLKPARDHHQEPVKTYDFKNDLYEITFNEKGHIESFLDLKQNRQLADKPMNVLKVYEDRPHNWDAWDINHYYTEKSITVDSLKSFEVIQEGLIFTKIRLTYSFQKSTFKQEIKLYKHKCLIEFNLEIDWYEDHLLLKVDFPTSLSANTAQYDTQFGYVERPTTRNHSWESAKFEVCGHKWATLREDNYGVALLNDSKYGYDILDKKISLSLLRSSTFPNPNADRGKHQFKYAFMVYDGNLNRVSDEGYSLNNPPESILKKGECHESYSYCECASESVVIETIKPSENRDGVIIRVYQNAQKIDETYLKLNFSFVSVYEVTVDEKIIKEITPSDQKINFVIGGFEIKTFKVIREHE
ncbi:MAG: alpha-mannosidase [Clostridia bacterium]|nr:alpha-mannosidase [Clostridia bacterium]